MGQKHTGRPSRRVDVQVSVFTAILVILSCLTIFYYHYHLTYDNMIDTLSARVNSLSAYAEHHLDRHTFTALNTPDDMTSDLYLTNQRLLNSARNATGVRYLYTATKTADGQFIYLLDGLDLTAADFRRPGDPIEPEIIAELDRAMSGEAVLPHTIKVTEWGKIFIAYLPIHADDEVIGVIGIEFEAEAQYNTYATLRIVTPLVILVACTAAAVFALLFFRRISNPTYRDLSNSDRLTQLKNRNAFDVDFDNLNASHRKDGVGILMADLNYLKIVNDTLGHQSGDRYLQLAAEALRTVCSAYGAAYRIGGDEFAVLLVGASADTPQQLISALGTQFEACKPDWDIDISFSIGYALFDSTQDSNLHDTFRRADEMMYRKKYARRRKAD